MAIVDKKPESATHSSKTGEGRRPRLPHEHDESSDSQDNNGVRSVVKQAHDDVESGMVDTDKGPPLDQAYRQQKSAVKKKAPTER